MIQPLVFFLVLLLLASPSLSQGSAGKMDNRPPRNNNTWLIHGMVFTHRVSPARPGPNTPPDVDKYPPLWGQFILVRSKIKRDQQGSFWNHLPAMLGVYCQHSFQLADLKNNVWGNCESYAEAAIGEEELSEDTKSRLKWRMLDYKTTKNKDSPFGSITFQIVNTLKPARYLQSHAPNAYTPTMETWSANLTMTSAMTTCQIQQNNYGGDEQCLIDRNPPGCIPMSGDCAHSIPVTSESLSEPSFERKYWKRKSTERDPKCPACPKQYAENDGHPIQHAKSRSLFTKEIRPFSIIHDDAEY